jgi:hypothetical protein
LNARPDSRLVTIEIATEGVDNNGNKIIIEGYVADVSDGEDSRRGFGIRVRLYDWEIKNLLKEGNAGHNNLNIECFKIEAINKNSPMQSISIYNPEIRISFNNISFTSKAHILRGFPYPLNYPFYGIVLYFDLDKDNRPQFAEWQRFVGEYLKPVDYGKGKEFKIL